jgi:hypothetical protein
MSRSAQLTAHRAAASALWELLRVDGPYREAWKQVARKEHLSAANGKVNVEAVRRLVLDRLWERGEFDSDPRSHENWQRRPWKDRIYGVANGRRLSIGTLEAFILAFGVSDDEAEPLRALHAGDGLPSPD